MGRALLAIGLGALLAAGLVLLVRGEGAREEVAGASPASPARPLAAGPEASSDRTLARALPPPRAPVDVPTLRTAVAGPAEIRFLTVDRGPIPFALYAAPDDDRDDFAEERWEAFVGLAEVPMPPFLTGTSDERGVARIPALPAGLYQVAVQDGHFVRGNGAVEHEPGGEYAIPLGEGVRLSGSVTDAAGAPVAGARVCAALNQSWSGTDGPSLFSRANYRRVLTDEEGGFVLDGLLPDGATSLMVAGSGFGTALEEVIATADGRATCNIRLPRAAILTVALLGDERYLGDGTRLCLLGKNPASWGSGMRWTDFDGNVELVLPDLTPATYEIHLQARHARAEPLQVTLAEGEHLRRTLDFRPRRVVDGIVTDADGRPMEAASVSLEWEDGDTNVRSDEHGAFLIEAPGVERAQLVVSARGFLEHRETWDPVPVYTPGAAPERIVLRRGLGVRCRAEVEGAPMDAFELELAHKPTGERVPGRKSTTRSEDGVATASGFGAGRLTGMLRARGRDGAELVGALEASLVEAKGLIPVVVELEPARSVSGVVVTRANVPVEKARVRVLSDVGVLYSRDVYAESGRTAADGTFTIGGLVPRDYVLVVWKGGYETRRIPLRARTMEAHQVVILDERD